MRRGEFIASAGVLFAAAYAPRAWSADDEAAVKQSVEGVYAAFSAFDKQKYRALLTEDYLLLENGELLDLEGDVAMMATADSGHRRVDAFDFRSVKVHGDTAYAVYFLKSEITDKKGARNLEWLESAILRRAGSGWRMALLHSTRIAKAGA
jgi:ketosteroid isomerase-like protein